MMLQTRSQKLQSGFKVKKEFPIDVLFLSAHFVNRSYTFIIYNFHCLTLFLNAYYTVRLPLTWQFSEYDEHNCSA